MLITEKQQIEKVRVYTSRTDAVGYIQEELVTKLFFLFIPIYTSRMIRNANI